MIKKIMDNTKLVLVYNPPQWYDYNLIRRDGLPNNFAMTFDRKYVKQAYCIIFHLPGLQDALEEDLDKPKGQIWVSWNLECVENYVWMKDPEATEMFDFRMDYHLDADVIHPYYEYDFINKFQEQKKCRKEKNICMFVSSDVNQSKRQEYLTELFKYVDVDSYGRFLNNQKLLIDEGVETKLKIYEKYKFIIAFENAIENDYVTEKFFDPLLCGTVPVYLGAPNINEFAPGDNCFVNVRDFNTPEELASFLNLCCKDESLYAQFHEWRKNSLRKEFVEKALIVKKNPISRLCDYLWMKI